MNDKEKIKNNIKKLIDKYELSKKSFSIRKYSEEETKKDFILPLFASLGWDVTNKNEVTAEESQSSGRVDYGFYLDGRIKFYLEAKSLKTDLHREEYANQAIRYSWNRGVTWAVLTDFESIKVFNVQDISKKLGDKLFFEIPYSQYLERFEQLWLLSKESFKNNFLDVEAEKYGKKLQKISVGTLLYKDLNTCRGILTHDLSAWNDKVPKDLLDEGIQRILDRLIFIRVAEDRGIEPSTLIPLIREWESRQNRNKVSLYKSMVSKFRELNDIYNSNLFSQHPFEEWEDYSNATKRVVDILYGKKGYYEYDFKVIPADVLGSVYENYLGYRLSKSRKGITLDIDARKRKEQGIYYTPDFIVDYIVKNSLKPVLDKCKNISDLKKIKVLDPACGSGSFLIKALEVIYDKYKDFGNPGGVYTKLTILLDNIFGVDLDQQAVEIARLNLLINTLDKRMKLPPLDKNIKNGNSLISGTDEELKKYFGKNFRDKKPFNWQEEFPDVFKQGGFDVIIGNPPWGANIDYESDFFSWRYPNSTRSYKDIYKIFVEKAITLLKGNGKLGFILPNTFLYQPRYQDIKDMIDLYEYYVVNLGEKIFENVQLPCCILLLAKEKSKSNNKLIIDVTKEDRDLLANRINSISLGKEKSRNKSLRNIIKKTGILFSDVFLLKDAGVKHQRTGVGKSEKGKSDLRERIYYSGKQKNIKDYPLYIGSDINRYIVYRKQTFFLKANYKSLLKENEIVYFDKKMMDFEEKIVWRQTADCIRATIIHSEWFANTLQVAILRKNYRNKISLYYALAVLNSQYIDYLYRQKVLESGKVFPQVKLRYLNNLPFVIAETRQQEIIATKAKDLMKLYKKLQNTSENSNKWFKIQVEIERIDKMIDSEVYKLYGLTPEEIKIVEGKK